MPERIDVRPVRTLRQFYALMEDTLALRAAVVADLDAGRDIPPHAVESLKNALVSLREAPGGGNDSGRVRHLSLAAPDGENAGTYMDADLGYEMGELEKDIFFLERGEWEFLEHLEELHPGLGEEVRMGREALQGLSFNAFVTDRDGTVNNYCARYRSSVQSIYNALFLTRFCRKAARTPVVLTSGPLQGPGILDVSAQPRGSVVFAASKGREFVDLEGNVRRFPVDAERQKRLDELNRRLEELLQAPGNQRFTLIGSGFQRKFGQSTVARQDINGSIPERESEDFLASLRDLVRELDPDDRYFRIEDTGLDVEIILTIESGEGGARDFDKGDGVRYLNRELGMDLDNGPHLICGDTASDVPMLEATLEHSRDTHAVFVTRKPELQQRVTALDDKVLVITEPDALVTILSSLDR